MLAKGEGGRWGGKLVQWNLVLQFLGLVVLCPWGVGRHYGGSGMIATEISDALAVVAVRTGHVFTD